MGDLETEPESVLLSNENKERFQCHGESGVLGSDDNVISIGMKRYVRKVSVSYVNLKLPEAYTGTDFVLK